MKKSGKAVICGAVWCLLTMAGPVQTGLTIEGKMPAAQSAPVHSAPAAGTLQQPPADRLKKPPTGCNPDIQTLGPLGCYDPGKIVMTFYGKCFGQQPGSNALAVLAKGSSTFHRFQAESWSDTQIRFRLPKVPDLKPSTQADLGIVNAQNQWLAKVWITTCTKEGTMPHYPLSRPDNVQVK